MSRLVLIFHPHFTISGGAGVFVLEVGSRLAAQGYKVVVYCIRCNPEIISAYKSKIEFIESGGKLSSSLLHWIAWPFFMLKLIRKCRQLNPDLIFPQVFPSNWWGFVYKKFNPDIKLLWMCQEPSAFIHSSVWIAAIRDPLMHLLLRVLNPLLKIIDCNLVKSADYILTNSLYGAEYARKVYGLSEHQLEPVYLGVDKKLFCDKGNKIFEARRCQITTIGRLTKFKNIDIILRALSILQKRGQTDIKLQIVGLGEELASLQSLAVELALGQAVNFRGALSNQELADLLSESRAFCLASVNEPFGLVVVEALSCGTPAIVTNSGGPAEIVEDGISGYYTEPMNPTDLADKLLEICTNAETFRRMSDAAKSRARNFDWDKTSRVVESHISRLLTDREQL